MTEYDWATTRAQAIDLFHDTPGAQLEQDVISHFVDDPERVIRTITRIAESPNILSKWAVLRSDLSRQAVANVTADNTRSRSKAIARAKSWIDNASLHYDRENHVEADLFGDDFGPGQIPDADQRTRDELLDYWRAARPRGEQAEAESEQYMADIKAARQRATELKRKAAEPEPEPDLEHAIASTADQDIDF